MRRGRGESGCDCCILGCLAELQKSERESHSHRGNSSIISLGEELRAIYIHQPQMMSVYCAKSQSRSAVGNPNYRKGGNDKDP